MAKQPKLGDEAFIYQPREEKSEREKLRDMPLKGKLAYLWEYYKFHALVTIIVATGVIYFVYTMTHPEPSTKFYAALINNTIDDKILNQYSEEFSGSLQLDPKKETINLNDKYHFDVDPEYSFNMKQALVTYIQARQVDVIIAPESVFKDYANNGVFIELSDQLPTDIYSSLTSDFYLTSTVDDKDKKVYGIYLTNAKLYQNHANNSDPYILGIVANSLHKENSVEFVKYLFDDK